VEHRRLAGQDDDQLTGHVTSPNERPGRLQTQPIGVGGQFGQAARIGVPKGGNVEERVGAVPSAAEPAMGTWE
jgi:hypothetical protein